MQIPVKKKNKAEFQLAFSFLDKWGYKN